MIHIFFMSSDIKNISINFKFNSRLYFLFQFTRGKTPMLSWRQIAAATYFHNRKRDTWVYFWRNTLNKSFRRNLSEWKRNCFFFVYTEKIIWRSVTRSESWKVREYRKDSQTPCPIIQGSKIRLGDEIFQKWNCSAVSGKKSASWSGFKISENQFMS